MRTAGWTLLVLGLVLCLSVVWAPLGLLMMGVGLVALQVAERKRRRARTAVAAASAGAGKRMEKVATVPSRGPNVIHEAPPAPVAPDGAPEAARNASPGGHDYDREEWRRLVESDAELAQLASVLGDYGLQYVDTFARNYLAAPNKSRISGIVDGIIARARSAQPARAPTPPERDRPPAPPAPEPKAARPRSGSGHARLASPSPAGTIQPAAATETPPPSETAGVPPTASPPTETAAPSNETAVAPPLQPPPEDVAIKPPKTGPAEPDQPGDSVPANSTDDDLTEMIRKFAPDSSFLRKT